MTGRDVRTKRNIRLRTQKYENVCKKYMIISIALIYIVAHRSMRLQKNEIGKEKDCPIRLLFFPLFLFLKGKSCADSRVINNNFMFYRWILLRARFRAKGDMRIGFTMISISRTASGVSTSAGCELSLVDNNNKWHVSFSRTSWYIIPCCSLIAIHRDINAPLTSFFTILRIRLRREALNNFFLTF